MIHILLLILAITYCLTILFIHSRIMKECNKIKAMPAHRKVVGIIYDNRPANLINKDLK